MSENPISYIDQDNPDDPIERIQEIILSELLVAGISNGEKIAVAVCEKIRREFGSSSIYVSKKPSVIKQNKYMRNIEILREYEEAKRCPHGSRTKRMRAISKNYGLNISHIYRIVQRQRAP